MTIKCSNCGRENKDEYTKEELESVFLSKKILQCRRCKKPISICGSIIIPNVEQTNKMEKIKTYDEIRDEQIGATEGEEKDMRNEVLDNIAEKINEIVDWVNKK